MNSNVRWAIGNDAKKVGKEVAKRAVVNMYKTQLAICASSDKYNTEELIEGIKTEIGTAPLIGMNTSSGVLTQDGYIYSQDGFLSMMTIGAEFRGQVITNIKAKTDNSSCYEDAKQMATEVLEKVKYSYEEQKPAFCIMFTNPGREEEYLKGIEEVLGTIPCFGGASDAGINNKIEIYTEDGIINYGLAIAVFFTDLKIEQLLESSYVENGNYGRITKANTLRQINEIDGKDALRQYGKWCNLQPAKLKGEKLKKKSVLYPIGIKDLDGSVKIYHPLNGNTDYSINVSNNIYENSTVMQMATNTENMIDEVAISLGKLKETSRALLMFYSGSKREFLEGKLLNVNNRIKEELDGNEYMLMFTDGQIGNKKAKNLCANLMVSINSLYQ